MKLWSGRFQKETDALVNDFNSSISFDARMYEEDITGSIAHATMLGECGIISAEDVSAIVNGLTVLLADIKDFAAMNAVYAKFFSGAFPARVCYQVAALPMGAKVEIDAVAVKL